MDGEKIPIQCRDSFRKWHKAFFVLEDETKTVKVFRKLGQKPHAVFVLRKISLSCVGKVIGFTKNKKSPFFIQFPTEEQAKEISSSLSIFTRDFTTELSLESFSDPVVMANDKGRIIGCNESFLKLMGYERMEIVGENVSIIMDSNIGRIHDQLVANYWKTGVRRLIGKSRLVRAKHKDGHLFPVVLQLGEIMEMIEGVSINRLIATIVDETTEKEEHTEASSTFSQNFSTEEEWSDEEEDEKIPTISYYLTMCTLMAHIEVKGSTVEGIFRMSGNFTESRELWQDIFLASSYTSSLLQYINHGYKDKEFNRESDVHNVCDVVKRALQEKELITPAVYDIVMENARKVEDPNVIINVTNSFLVLREESQMVLGRLFLMFSHILSMNTENKMTAENLAIVTAPLLFQPPIEQMVEHILLLSPLLTKMILKSHLVSFMLPQGKPEPIFKGPGKLSDTDWAILMTHCEIVDFSPGDSIVPDDGRNTRLYYIASGIVSIQKENKPISTVYSGEYISEMSTITGAPSKTVVAIQPCKIIKISVAFLSGLFDSDRDMFYKFFWEQARKVATRLANLPLITAELDAQHKTVKGESTKLEIHLPDGSSRWMDFSLNYTVDNIRKELERLYPKLSKKAYLTETSHGRDLVRLQPEWTVNELLIRAKYACDYKIIFNAETSKDSKVKISTEESIVIKQFSCKRKKKQGTLFILQTSIVHVSKLFGLHTRSNVDYRDVLNSRQDGIHLSLECVGNAKNCVFTFQTEDECSEVRRLIQSLACSILSPRDRKQSIEFQTQTWAVVLKRYKILKPVLVDLKPGDMVRITDERSEPGMVCACFKDVPVSIPCENIEKVSDEVTESPLFISEDFVQEINYPGLEQLPSKRDWATLLLRGKLVRFKAGSLIIPQGSRVQRLYHIVSGFCTVQILLPRDEGNALASSSSRWKSSIKPEPDDLPFSSLVVKTLGSGENFGEISLLTGEGTNATVVAEGKGEKGFTTVFMVEAQDLVTLFEQSPKIGGRFAKYMHGLLLRRINFETSNRNTNLNIIEQV